MKFSEEEHNLYRELHASKQYQLEAHDRSYALMQELATCRATLETLGKITNTENPKSIEFGEDDASIIIDEVIGEIRERSHAIVMALAEAVKDEKAAKKVQKDIERKLEELEDKEAARRQIEAEQKAAGEAEMLAKKIAEVEVLRKQCEKYQLENREILEKFSDEELARIFNGIGPSTFPDWMREALDDLHPSLRCVALIHDVENELSDGTKEGFKASNKRFRKNGNKVAKAEFSWYNPRRYAVMLNAATYSWLCQHCGWEYWAHKEARKWK